MYIYILQNLPILRVQFNILTNVYSHVIATKIKIQNISVNSKTFPHAFLHSDPVPTGQQPPFFMSLQFCLFKMSYKITHCLVFCICLPSHRMFLILMLLCVSLLLFHFIVEWYFTVWIYYDLYVHSLVDTEINFSLELLYIKKL